MAKVKTKTKNCQLIVKVHLSFREKLNENELNDFSRKYVRGLLKVNRRKKNCIEYSGPIGVSLYQRLKKPVSKYDFFFIMEQMIDLIQKMNNAALKLDCVVLDIHHVYINEKTKELQFVFLPLFKPMSDVTILDFMYNFIYSVTPLQEQDDSYISEFVYFLQGMQRFDPEKIEAYIEKEDRKVVQIIKKHNVGQSGFMTDKPRDYYEHYDGKEEDEATGLLEDEETTRMLREDENTVLLQDDELTGLLSEERYGAHYASLYREISKETISINEPVFRIGHEKKYSNYLIEDNCAISKSHADIITRGQKYYIMDLNSTNKTYVNGSPIIPRQEVEIRDGDHVRLGNEEFVFHT